MPIRIKIPNEYKDGYKKIRNRFIAIAFVISFCAILFSGILLYAFKVFIESNPPTIYGISTAQVEEVIPPVPKESISGGKSPVAPPIDIIISADIQEVNITTVDFPSDNNGNGNGNGIGDGIGDGIGPGEGPGAGMGSEKKSDSGFRGQFWDLKRLRNGKPSPFELPRANTATLSMLSRFYNSNWDTKQFESYYKSPRQLNTSCFYMPFSLDKEATNAYDPTGRFKLKEGRWVAIYRAKVQAPQSGTFRFVGIGDSVLSVRFNGKNVFTSSMHTITDGTFFGAERESFRRDKTFYPYSTIKVWNEEAGLGGFIAGDDFEVRQGDWYDMDVMISEIGGGFFGFCLLIDEVSDKSPRPKTKCGQPIFQLFRTMLVAPSCEELYKTMRYPDDGSDNVEMPYDPDSSVWPARPR